MDKKIFIILFVGIILLSGCTKKPEDIFKACLKGNLSKVETIVNLYPSSLELLDDIGMSPIFSAVTGPNPKVVEFLISKGVDVNEKSELGFTPIAFAIQKYRFETVKLLLNNGVDINAKIYSGLTPLHFAVKDIKNLELISYLITNGANINSKDNFLHISPLQVAKEAKNETIIKMLISLGAKD